VAVVVIGPACHPARRRLGPGLGRIGIFSLRTAPLAAGVSAATRYAQGGQDGSVGRMQAARALVEATAFNGGVVILRHPVLQP
jgi:hypothetical protein